MFFITIVRGSETVCPNFFCRGVPVRKVCGCVGQVELPHDAARRLTVHIVFNPFIFQTLLASEREPPLTVLCVAPGLSAAVHYHVVLDFYSSGTDVLHTCFNNS